MCPFMAEGTNIDPWMQFFKTLMDKPVPAEFESFTEDPDVIEERDKHIVWKVKGIATKMTYRLFSKYGNPTFVDDKFTDFSKRMREVFAVPLLESHLQQVFKRKTHFVGSKSLNFSIKYLTQSAKLSVTMKVLYPLIERILYESVIPVMQINQKDI